MHDSMINKKRFEQSMLFTVVEVLNSFVVDFLNVKPLILFNIGHIASLFAKAEMQ